MKDILNTSNVSHSKNKNRASSSFAIGSDAASSYYFSSMPKTPAVKSARKKLRQSSSQLKETQPIDGENRDPQLHEHLSLLDATLDGLANQNLSSTSLLLSPQNINDIPSKEDENDEDWNQNNDSTVSSAYSDNLNKSVLSDTTELTASNYVFAAASRNRLEESMLEFKALQKQKHQQQQEEEDEKQLRLQRDKQMQQKQQASDDTITSNKEDEATTEDLKALLQENYTQMQENHDSENELDQYLKGNDESTSSDDSLLHDSTLIDHPLTGNPENPTKVPLMEDVMKFEEGESFLSVNDSVVKSDGTKDDIDEEDMTNHSNVRNTLSSIPSQDDQTSYANHRLSTTPVLDFSFSASRSRRLSSLSLHRPESELKKHSRRIQSITESIAKSRQYRESVKKSVAKARNSLPPSSDFAVGLPALNHMKMNPKINHDQEEEEDGLEATFKAKNTRSHLDTTFDQSSDKINDILGGLNHDADESMEHVSPEKLNLSLVQTQLSSPAGKSIIQGLYKSPLLDRTVVPNLPSAERVFNPLFASPGRHTRSQMKKRKSTEATDSFIALESVSKKVNLNSTPKDKDHGKLSSQFSVASVSTAPHEDDTINLLNFIVPHVKSVAQMDTSMTIHEDDNVGDTKMPHSSNNAIALESESAGNDEHSPAHVPSQGSEETLVVPSSGSSSTSNHSAKDSVSSKRSRLSSASQAGRGHESSSTYRLINSVDESMASSVAELSTRACVKSPFNAPTSITKAVAVDINSPFLGSDDEDDGTVRSSLSFRSINSPASSGSNDDASSVTSASTKLDNRFQEADTIDFKDVLIGKYDMKTQISSRRSSSRFSITKFIATDDNTMSSCNLADTLDIQQLLSDQSVKKSSMNSIQEHYVEENGIDAASPRNKSCRVTSSVATPKSILKRRKGYTPKLNVVFYPPTAAEYNIGSPASKFTPMCEEVTRERFQVPVSNIDESVEEKTVEIDSNLQKLLQDVSSSDKKFQSNQYFDDEHDDDSSSKSSCHHDEAHTVGLENNLNTILEDLMDGTSNSTLEDIHHRNQDDNVELDSSFNNAINETGDAHQYSDSCMDDADDTYTLSLNNVLVQQRLQEDTVVLEKDLKSNITSSDDHTVGLDSDLKLLIGTCGNSGRLSVGTVDEESYSLRDNFTGHDKEVNTVALEPGLKMIVGSFASSYDDTGTLSLRNASIMKPMEGDTIELESDLRKLIGHYNESFCSTSNNESLRNEDDTISLNDASIVQQSHGDTVELESDLKKLFNKVDSSESTANISLKEKNVISCDVTETLEQDVASFLSKNVPMKSDVSFEHDSISQEMFAGSDSKSETSGLIKSLERVVNGDISGNDDTIDLNSSPNLHNSNRRSSRRISLVPPASDRTSSTDDFSGISGLLKDSNDSIASASPIQKEVIDVKWAEVVSIFFSFRNHDLFHDIHDLLMQESRNLLSGYNHPQMVEFLKDFFDTVCSELDEGADDTICNDAILSDLIDIPEDTMLCVQKCVRGESSHAAFMDLKQKSQMLEKASFDVVGFEFVKWEALVANALSSRIVEMKSDVDDDDLEISRQLELSERIQDSLHILSQEKMRIARSEDMKKKKVRQN